MSGAQARLVELQTNVAETRRQTEICKATLDNLERESELLCKLWEQLKGSDGRSESNQTAADVEARSIVKTRKFLNTRPYLLYR